VVPASLVVAATGVWVLGAVAFTWVAQLGPVSRYGQWSAEQLRDDSPIPRVIAIGATVLAVLSVGRAAACGTRRLRLLLAVRQSCRGVGVPGSLVVLDNDRPDAFATPGARGRIVVTRGLLRALNADERRALLAHETAHLAHRHACWLLVAELAAAANPMLTPTARAVRHTVERWADEDAARAVADRRLVARTLPAVGGDVPGRVRALLEPPPRQRVAPLFVLVALLVVATMAAGTVQRRGDELLDHAGTGNPAVSHHRPGH